MSKHTIDIENKRVAIKHNTMCVDTKKALQGEKQVKPSFEHIFDFSDCSDEQILGWAAENRLIAWRGLHKVKDLTEEKVKALDTTINCATAFIRTKKEKKVDPALQALQELALKLHTTPAELLEKVRKEAEEEA